MSFLIARDTIHQEQWLAVIEELGGIEKVTPILNTSMDKDAPDGRWTSGPSIDGRGEFSAAQAEPHDQAPTLGKARKGSGGQNEQM